MKKMIAAVCLLALVGCVTPGTPKQQEKAGQEAAKFVYDSVSFITANPILLGISVFLPEPTKEESK